jgi:adenine phosphoribosyltransferase
MKRKENPMEDLKALIRTVQDFPKKGIGFKDITTLIKNGPALGLAVDQLAELFAGKQAEVVVGVESRGFIFGTALAYKMGLGFVPVRKPGKLPAKTIREEYQLEYGTDAIEIHQDAIQTGQKVLIIDDLLATGGTVAATTRLVERMGGDIVGIGFLIELDFLNGRDKISQYAVQSLVHYDGE